MILLSHILSQSLLFLPLALGIFLSYRVLRCTDLTVDGSFVLGAAVFARTSVAGADALLAQLAALAAGAAIGLVVSIVQRRVQPLLAGILLLFVLHSVNLQVMGRPNISLLGVACLPHSFVALAVLGTVLIAALYALLRSRAGLLLRAFGNNPRLIKQQGHSQDILRAAGLMLSNAMVAGCGALTAQVNGYADVQMGFGMVMIGIGTVVLGQQCIQHLYRPARFRPLLELCGCFLGVLLYFSALHGFLALGFDPLYLKMLIGVSLIGCMMSTGGCHV
jgi:putative ABC transport system permease protein